MAIFGLAFSLDGTAVAARITEWQGWLEPAAWDIQTGETISNTNQISWFNAASIDGNTAGHLIALKWDDYILNVTDLQTGELLASVADEEGLSVCGAGNYLLFSVSADNRFLAIGCSEDAISVWDLKQQRLMYKLAGHIGSNNDGPQTNVTAIRFSPYGYLLVSGGIDDTLRFWNAQTGQLLYTIREYCSIQDIAFSPDGRYLASYSCDGTLRLWGLPSK